MASNKDVAQGILTGALDAYAEGAKLQGSKFFGEAVAMSLVSDKAKFKAFVAGFNNEPAPDQKTPLQPVAAPASIPKSKEGSMNKITTQEDFIANGAADPVALESGGALKVGQRVHGTTAGAVYYVIGVLDGLAVAMRWKGSQLSVRISGPKLAEFAERLTATGLYANKGTYFSAHMGQQGVVDGIAASVSAQMLFASVLAGIAGDPIYFEERAPYDWRQWLAVGTIN